MYANLCPETVGIRKLPWREHIDLAADAGFGGVDLPLDRLRDTAEARDAGEHLRGRGLRWGLFWLPWDVVGADDARTQAGLARLDELLPLVRAAGCARTYLHIMPGHATLAAAENRAHHLARLRPVAARLRAAGVTLGLEFIGPRTKRDAFRHPFLRTLPEILELADEIGSGTGVVVDTFHWWTSGGSLDDLRRLLPGRAVVNVHANDARAGRARDEQLDHERELPLASGLVDAAGVLAALAALGYDGPVIAEPFSPQRERLAALPPRQAADEVAEVLRGLFARMRSG